MAIIDVSGALAHMRILLGSGHPPQWPQPPFGSAVPPATTWDGELSDKAHNASGALNRRRVLLAQTHAAIGPVLEQAGRITSSARDQMDSIQRQYQADKAAFAPIANTAAGQLALAQLGQLRLSQGTRVVQTAQAAFAGLAGQVAGLTTELSKPAAAQGYRATPADFFTGGPDGTEPPGPREIIDPDNPFVGDPRFGYWEDYIPAPYTGAKPPPPPFEHRQLEVPSPPGGPSGFYTPGRTWPDDSSAPWASLAEQYNTRISGQDFTQYTRVVNVDGVPHTQRWVANTYETQKWTQVNLNGSIWSKTAPNELEGTLGGTTTGGIGGAIIPANPGPWQPITPNQMSNLSTLNPGVTYYVPDGLGGKFTFVDGQPVGGTNAPGPTVPIMTMPRP
jgi:hypothetical protein